MATPRDVLEQLLSAEHAGVLVRAGASAWQSVAHILGVVMDEPPELDGLDGRLVMPDEIEGDFEEPHLVAAFELSNARDQSASAYAVFQTRLIAPLLNSVADDPLEQEQQSIVIGSTILGQALQAVNRDVFTGASSGIVVTLDDVTANTMPSILSSLDEPGLLLTGTLTGGHSAPFTMLFPGTFLDTLASSLPHDAGQPAAAGIGSAAGSLPFSLTAEEIEQAPVVDLAARGQPVGAGAGRGGDSFEMPAREPTPISAGPAAHRARFAPLPDPEPVAARGNIDLLANLEMNVSVELGRTELTVADILALGPGSVIELDRLAGEPVDILVNDRLVARGEVVVVDENFGVRVVEVVRHRNDEERTG